MFNGIIPFNSIIR